MKNILDKESSPYLLQHANNPVHWQPWNDDSLQLAMTRNKLLIVSIGYSACHWCHVMEHESFENVDVATVMNANFINIKIDREERPDIDNVYMKAVQIMTGSGGWPLNVVCLPDGRPIWGGTYFRKNEWTNTLEQLTEMYHNEPEKIISYAEKLHNGIKNISIITKDNGADEQSFNDFSLENLVQKWSKSFDLDFGGLTRAPKFMMPNNYNFLLHYAQYSKNEQLQSFVDLTLTKMAYGGIFDTVGGGFSRYSVDLKWHIPHFEKMLYDNAQLISLYSNAYKNSQNPLYKTIIEKSIAFIQNDLNNLEGGFYCALDADSLNANNVLEEGAFYVWTKTELQTLFGNDFDLFSIIFNVNEFGFWENGHYVLIQNKPLTNIAIEQNIPLTSLIDKKKTWEKILFDERLKRPQPRLDSKCLCGWNAMTIVGLIDAYQALGDEEYLNLAIKNAHFIVNKMWSPEGFLYRNYTNGKVSIAGFLEDYAHTIAAFISLYQATFDTKWLLKAKQLTDYCLDNFYDQSSGFFTFTNNKTEVLLAAQYETEDNVIPASNSVICHNLIYLGIAFENPHYTDVAQKMLQHILPTIDYPSAFSNWLSAYLKTTSAQIEVAIIGENALTESKILAETYHPNSMIFGDNQKSTIPFLKHKFVENKTLFYTCQNKTCGLASEKFTLI